MIGGRKLWFRFTLGSEEWSVWIVDPMEHNIMDNCEGLTICTLAAIYINDHVVPGKRASVFFHELLHAVNFYSGLEKVGAHIFGVPEITESMEEALVTMLAPILHDTLLRNGFLKLPKVPIR